MWCVVVVRCVVGNRGGVGQQPLLLSVPADAGEDIRRAVVTGVAEGFYELPCARSVAFVCFVDVVHDGVV